jgi:hypothetical protein
MRLSLPRIIGVVVVLSLIVAVVVAQMPADPAPEYGWHWTRIYGQKVQVWAFKNEKGYLWLGKDAWNPLKLAPVEWARRQAEAEREKREKDEAEADKPPLVNPPLPSPQRPAFETNGVDATKLNADDRAIRASDPKTRVEAIQKAADAGVGGTDLRASDAATYQQAVEAAERKAPRQPEYCEVHGTDKCPNGGGCRKPAPEPEKKPGVLDRAEMDAERVIKLLACLVVLIGGVAFLFKAFNAKPQG